jgi:DNA-binding XRE family transcriptional regulator
VEKRQKNMKTAYVIDIDAATYNDQYYEITYPAEVYETEAEALKALEAYNVNNCRDCIVNGDADNILMVWVSVARCDYNPEDIDGELDACALLSEAKTTNVYTKEFVLGAEAVCGTDYYCEDYRIGAHPFTDAEIKEGKGASMTLTDAAGKVIKSETYTRKSDRSEWTTAIGRTTRKAVGLAIAQARNAAGLSVRDLADRCGLDAGHLCRIENGRMNVTLDTVAKICEALGLRLEAVSGSETK